MPAKYFQIPALADDCKTDGSRHAIRPWEPRLAVLAVLCLGMLTGCTASGLAPLGMGGLWKSSEEAERLATPRGELPPKEAAKACMAAAEELQKNGHADQAIVLYEKARTHDPSLASVSHRLAVLYDAKNDSVRALAEYKKALEREPRNADLLSDVGYYYHQRENHAEAESYLRKALAVSPDHEKALSNLALTLAAQGRFDESREMFAKVVGPAAAYSNIGVLMAQQGRYDEAKQSFREAAALDSSLQQPKAFLAYLEDRQPSVAAQPKGGLTNPR